LSKQCRHVFSATLAILVLMCAGEVADAVFHP